MSELPINCRLWDMGELSYVTARGSGRIMTVAQINEANRELWKKRPTPEQLMLQEILERIEAIEQRLNPPQ